MMFGCYDYSCEDVGCCLNCPNSYEGCLCFDCKCSKCLYYTPPQDWDGSHGKCELAMELSQSKKKELSEFYSKSWWINFMKRKNKFNLRKQKYLWEFKQTNNKLSPSE